MINMNNITEIIPLLKNAKSAVGFTGAGISVESGVPPFTGKGGLWEKYDPIFIEINFFQNDPVASWREMNRIFFSCMGKAKPNKAHRVLADLEQKGLLKGIITQNIDGLHQAAGSRNVQEFHGTIYTVSCTQCGRKRPMEGLDTSTAPFCDCGGVFKPDFVFYGEGIHPQVYENSLKLAQEADVMLVVGTAGQVMPACHLPLLAKQNGAKIIEVNTLPSTFTNAVTDYYFPVKATDFFEELEKQMN